MKRIKKYIIFTFMILVLSATIFEFGCSLSKYNVNITSTNSYCTVSGGGSYQAGKKVTISAKITDENACEWQGWYLNDYLYTDKMEFTYTVQTKNVNFVAKCSGTFINVYCYSNIENNYTNVNPDYIILSYVNDANGKNGIEVGTIPTIYDDVLNIEGCNFEGWYSDPELTNQVSDSNGVFLKAFTKDLTYLYAKWSVKTNELKLSSNSNLTEFKIYVKNANGNYELTDKTSFRYNTEIKIEVYNSGVNDGQNKFNGWGKNIDDSSVVYEENQRIIKFRMPDNEVILNANYIMSDSGYEFDTTGNSCILVKYYGDDAICNIPFTFNGKPVDTIGKNAFKESECEAVIITHKIARIEDTAFFGSDAKIFFDQGSDFNLIKDTCFRPENMIYIDIKYGYDLYYDIGRSILIDGLGVVKNGEVGDTLISNQAELDLILEYVYINNIDKEIIVTLESDVKLPSDRIKDFVVYYTTNVLMQGIASIPGTNQVSIKMPKILDNTSDFASIVSKEQYERDYDDFLCDEMEFKVNFDSGKMSYTTNPDNTRILAIEQVERYSIVETSEQLLDAIEHGFRPVFLNDCIAKKVYEKAISILRNIIDDTMSEYEKTLAIHDYIINNTIIDSFYNDAHTTARYPNKRYLFRAQYLEGVILDGMADTVAYQKAFSFLLGMEGITNIRYKGTQQTISVDNEILNQTVIWNKVYLQVGEDTQKRWYNIDIRQDEIYNINEANYEILSHKAFMLSDNDMTLTGSDGSVRKYITDNENYKSDVSYRKQYFMNVKFGDVSLYFDELDSVEAQMRIMNDLSTKVLEYFMENTELQFFTLEFAVRGNISIGELGSYNSWFAANNILRLGAYLQNSDDEGITVAVLVYFVDQN